MYTKAFQFCTDYWTKKEICNCTQDYLFSKYDSEMYLDNSNILSKIDSLKIIECYQKIIVRDKLNN